MKLTTVHDIMNLDNSNSVVSGSAEVKIKTIVKCYGNLDAVFIEGYVLYLVVADEYNNVSDITEKVISLIQTP